MAVKAVSYTANGKEYKYRYLHFLINSETPLGEFAAERIKASGKSPKEFLEALLAAEQIRLKRKANK